MDKDNRYNPLAPGWRQRTTDRNVSSYPNYNLSSVVDQNNGAMSLAESRYLQSQMMQLSGLNSRFNHIGQLQTQGNVSLPTLSSYHNPMIDVDNRISRNQNILPLQDQQIFFNQEHQRLKDRLFQEIWETKQNADNTHSSQFFQDDIMRQAYNEEHTNVLMKNLIESRKAEELRRNMDKQIRDNRLELYLQKKLQQDLYARDYNDRAYSTQSIAPSDKNSYDTLMTPPEDTSRRNNAFSSNVYNEKESTKLAKAHDNLTKTHPSSIRKQSVSKERDSIAHSSSHVAEPPKCNVNSVTDVVDLTDDVELNMDDTASASNALDQKDPLTAQSLTVEHPPKAPTLEETEEQLRLSLIVEAIDQESFVTLLQSSEKPTLSVDSDALIQEDKISSVHEEEQQPTSSSKYFPERVLSSLKLNKELFNIEQSKDINDRLPKLPSEPPSLVDSILLDYEEKDRFQLPVVDVDSTMSLAVTEPTYIRLKPTTDVSTQEPSSTLSEPWWPKPTSQSNKSSITNGRNHSKYSTSQKSVPFNLSAAMHESLMNDAEPGALEKLPYCKLYEKRSSNNDELQSTRLYCIQVTTMFCMSTILCCSECYTWRHAECGGHHTGLKFSARNLCDNKNFRPICDRCFNEKALLLRYPDAKKRVQKQRIDHLRREQLTSAVMNEAAPSSVLKRSLGSVSDALFPSRIKNINMTYEKALKHWNSMVDAIGMHSNTSKSKADTKEKEYDRLLRYFEDAEEATDRHNMILFLQRDISRKVPIGFDGVRINIFDPADDSELPEIDTSRSNKKKRKERCNDIHNEYAPNESTTQEVSSSEEKYAVNDKGAKKVSDVTMENNEDVTCLNISTNGQRNRNQDKEVDPLSQVIPSSDKCIRSCCFEKRRFDSLFCSDGCGVASMESDILRSLLSHASFRNRRRLTKGKA